MASRITAAYWRVWYHFGPGHTGTVRITIRVRPGASHPGVGGEHDGALVVDVAGADPAVLDSLLAR